MAGKVEVVKVIREGSDIVVLSKNPDGTVDRTPLPPCGKTNKRMGARQSQFFYGERNGVGWKLGAYAPYQPW